MKALYFATLVGERAASPVQTQVYESLKPFQHYVKSAIDAANDRRARYRVAWRVVPEARRIRLRELDTFHELRPGPARYRLEGWPADVEPDAGTQLIAVKRTQLLSVLEVVRSPGGFLISLAEPVDPDEQFFWSGRGCRLVPVSGEEAVPRVFDEHGRVLRIRAQTPVTGSVRMVVEGIVSKLFDEHGAPVASNVLDAYTGLEELVDARGMKLSTPEGDELEVPQLPADGPLNGNNGVRFEWAQPRGARGQKQRGTWVQLLSPEDLDSDETVDPRAAFCEEGVFEVRVESGPGARPQSYKVFGFKRSSYRLLLERVPAAGSLLQLPVDTKNLRRQRSALFSLAETPLPHYRGLVRLLEDPQRTRWDERSPEPPAEWFVLKDEGFSGTDRQRDFVAKALATPDLAFLEGPPGSGKTHAISELVLQLIKRNKRVLLCSTTHVAVDNVLERLVGHFPQVEAVRVGRVERVDRRVRSRQLDELKKKLAADWRPLPRFDRFSDDDLEQMAENVVLDAANLTCGTTLGILAHPSLRAADENRFPRFPRYDVLILDEASKTTFQELLVPSLFARKWIIVGDVRQLPPMTERADLEAALRDLTGEKGAQTLSRAHQRACLLHQRLSRRALSGKARWLVAESDEVLSQLAREGMARATAPQGPEAAPLEMVRIVNRPPAAPSRFYAEVSVRQLGEGAPAALRLMSSAVVLVEPELLAKVERWLPADLCWVRPEAARPLMMATFRGKRWRRVAGVLPVPVRERGRQSRRAEELELQEGKFLAERDWAGEVAWRLARSHELGASQSRAERERYQRELDVLVPRAEPEARWVRAAVGAMQDIGLRSAIEQLQRGVGTQHARRMSALTDGIPKAVWDRRAVLLSHQHRMHPDISALPRELFYEQRALLDANTLAGRDQRVGWTFGAELPTRRAWVEVHGREERGANLAEVEAVRGWVRRFLDWARQHPRPDGKRWQVACLSFYVRQEGALREMLRRETAQSEGETRFEGPGFEISCGTVDRFQGREADLVLLSFRNTERVGFLDSPHRLNVAITRARHLLLLFGNRRYFLSCERDELQRLAECTTVAAPARRERG
ncbi:MAG TPA: AAA domain-containing protein [Longimicrobium sp.]|nr:AAA domain-containing protein [Longimicrobium sp.]